MKRIRYLLIVLMSAFFINAEAGDTLTRAQVYNFNVGDTFDYRNYSLCCTFSPPPSDSQISYTRYVVSNIYWSSDTQTKYIVRTQLYPIPITSDTITLSNINGYEVILDSIANYAGYYTDTFATSGLQPFFGRKTNFSTFWCCSPGWKSILFANGLGPVIINQWGFAHNYWYNDSTILIYYFSDSGTYGTPYTSYPNVIGNLTSKESINIYPSPNNGTFTIETQNETHLPLDISIYNLQGQKLFEETMNDYSLVVQLSDLSNGLYIWRASSNGNTLQKGKMVITQ